MSTNVPAAYVPLLEEMSSATGISYNVLAAQANDESGFNARAISSAGAEGWLQFLPSTYAGVADQAGVPANSEFVPADEAKAYIVYMNQLLKQEGGNVQDALAAYNAGPGNIAAGQGYATSILTAAGSPVNTVAGPAQGTGAPTATGGSSAGGFNFFNPTTWTPGNVLKATIGGILGKTNFGEDIVNILERGALMLFGAVLVIIGIIRLSGQTENAKSKGKEYVQGKRQGGEVEEAAEEAPEVVAA